ncbi:pentatricopeptide repeat-containing protein At5g64320, mitochondrial-like [Cynara cardunculus var. scolymus]|nr:pentatricopeptide repeat-containing protein At5g64320, mitochondrial-like [Cynara cardunculus var. scolymus]
MPIINMLCRHALVPEAELYLGRMLKFDVCPDVYVFTSLILGYGRYKHIKSGFRVWKEMTDQGITPNALTYNHLINALCHVVRVDDALDMLNTMIRNGNLNKGMMLLSKVTNVGPLPMVASYNILMYGCIEQMDLNNAIRLLSLMKENGLKPDQRTYGVLIYGFCKAGDLDGGLALFGEMVEQKVMPNEYHYTSLIDAHIKQDEVEAVLFLLREEGCRPEAEAYNSIIDCCCKRNRLRETIQVFMTMGEKEVAPNEDTYKTLVDGLCQDVGLNHVKVVICCLYKRGETSKGIELLEYL